MVGAERFTSRREELKGGGKREEERRREWGRLKKRGKVAQEEEKDKEGAHQVEGAEIEVCSLWVSKVINKVIQGSSKALSKSGGR